MNLIDNITDEPFQTTKIVLDDGSVVQLNLTYRPAIQRWMLDVIYGERTINSLAVCSHPNLLRPWRQLIPFGLACVTNDGADPVSQDDFSTARAIFYVLSEADVAEVEASVLGVS